MDNRDEIEISVLDIFIDFWKYRGIIFLLALLGLAAGILFSFGSSEDTYTTKASLLVNAKNSSGFYSGNQISPEVNEVYLSQDLTSTVEELALSSRVLAAVAEEVGLDDEEIEQIRKSMTVTSKENTSFINISLGWPDEKQAVEIVNSLMEVLPEVMRKVMDIGSVNVIDYAEEAFPVQSEPVKPIVIGGLAGILLGCFFAAFFGIAVPRVRSAEDVERQFSLEIIGEIPCAEKGKSLLSEENTGLYKEAYGAFASIFRFLTSKGGQKAVAISSAIQSEGKSTIAYNLAYSLAVQRKKVLLLDFDFRRKTLSHLINMEDEANDVKENWGENCRDIGVNGHLWMVSGIHSRDAAVYAKEVKEAVNRWKEKFDYIIVDTPPLCVVPDVMYLRNIIDGVIFVVKHNESLIKDIQKAVNRLKKIEIPALGCVVNEIADSAPGYTHYKKYGHYYDAALPEMGDREIEAEE